MTIDTNTIIKVVDDLMGNQEIQVAVVQSGSGALITSLCTFVGGMVAGPIGLAVGGASGGLLAAYKTQGTFKPIRQILNELPFERKQQIAAEIQAIMQKLEINDLVEFGGMAVICLSMANSKGNANYRLVQSFIEQSLPVIQKHVQNI